MQVWSLGWEDPLKEHVATHSSILAWRIPWTEEPGGLPSTGSQRVGHDWSDLVRAHTHTHTPFTLALTGKLVQITKIVFHRLAHVSFHQYHLPIVPIPFWALVCQGHRDFYKLFPHSLNIKNAEFQIYLTVFNIKHLGYVWPLLNNSPGVDLLFYVFSSFSLW